LARLGLDHRDLRGRVIDQILWWYRESESQIWVVEGSILDESLSRILPEYDPFKATQVFVCGHAIHVRALLPVVRQLPDRLLPFSRIRMRGQEAGERATAALAETVQGYEELCRLACLVSG